MKISWWYL